VTKDNSDFRPPDSSLTPRQALKTTAFYQLWFIYLFNGQGIQFVSGLYKVNSCIVLTPLVQGSPCFFNFKHILLFNKKQLDRTQVSQLRNVFTMLDTQTYWRLIIQHCILKHACRFNTSIKNSIRVGAVWW